MNEQMLEELPNFGRIYAVLFKNIKEIYEDSIGLIQVLRSINDEKMMKDQLINKEMEIMQTIEAAEKIEAEWENYKSQLEQVILERDQLKAELEEVHNQSQQQKVQYDNIQKQNKMLTINGNLDKISGYQQEINELKSENANMVKILIKRWKKDILSQNYEFTHSAEGLKGSPQKSLLQTPQRIIGLIIFAKILDSNEETPKNLFLHHTGKSTPLGKIREKILTLNQVNWIF